MALSLIDLLELPPNKRSESNINLNIPSLKRKCDLFYYLADKEASKILRQSELFRSSEDMPLSIAQTNLCILMRGKVSLCHKTQTILAPTGSPDLNAQDENSEDKTDEDGKNEEGKCEESESKGEKKKSISDEKKKSLTAAARGVMVIQMVTALLDRRNTLKEEERAMSIAEARKKSMAQGNSIAIESPEVFVSKAVLYGRPTVHYSEGAYFGGPDMPHKNDNNNQTDQFTFVSDTPCLLLVIPSELQSTIVNYHYLNLIRDKESLLTKHHITKRLTMPQRSALLHEMLEEHFIHGNVLTKKGEPADTVYLIKSGFVRIYLDVKVPRVILPEAVQHLPSTRLRQGVKHERLPVIDMGPGEFVGGFEHVVGRRDYMFTMVATCETTTYSIRTPQFKEMILKPSSKSLELFTNDMKARWRVRRLLADFSLCPKTEEILSTLLGEDTSEMDNEEAKAELEALKSHLPSQRRSLVPHYLMGQNVQLERAEERQSLRPPNRGPFADRVRNRMIELGFSSRRGI